MGYNIGGKYLQAQEQPFTAIEICLSRSFFGMILCYLILKYKKIDVYYGVTSDQRKWLLIRAFMGIFYFSTYTYCLGKGAVSTVFLAQNLAPMITSIMARYLFKEFLNRLDIVSLIVGFLGILLILLPKQGDQAHIHYDALDIFIIMTLPFQLSALQIFLRQMKTIHFALINFYYTFVCSIGYFIFLVITNIDGFNLEKFTLYQTSILVLSSFSHVGAIICYTLALQKAKAGRIGIIAYSQIIYSMVVDLFIFDIKFNMIQAIGMIIVFAVGLIITIAQFKICALAHRARALQKQLPRSIQYFIFGIKLWFIEEDDEEGKWTDDQVINLKNQRRAQGIYNNFTIASKTIRVLVEEGIQFDIDVLTDDLTCGWLISEVTRLYKDFLHQKQKLIAQYPNKEKDFHQIIQMNRRQQLNFQHNRNNSQNKVKDKLIVALKTYDQNENLDYWLTMYDRNLAPLQDGEVLLAHFAKVSHKKHISPGAFEAIKVIGRGGFSRVLLCRKKDTGRLYAMKILKKSKIIREKKIKPILSERAVLEQIDHPFIVKLHWAFQSKEELFFILDLCTGGEIFFHLNNLKRFPEQLARFYFSEIILGVEYLHSKDIVYRDIKPENILVDIEGHIKIADFGLAKYIPNRQKSYSFCGSPEYMCPEMLKNRGHDRQLDYYCLGALLYEMLTGLPPYYSKDTNEMYYRILNESLSFPEFINQNHPVVDLLTRLLAKDPAKRIKSVEEIKEHPWLKDQNWKALLNKEITPPFMPSMRESNFDPEFNDLPCDFDELEMKQRLMTERRQSYYIESTIQSKNCTENSFYFQNHPSAVVNEALLNAKLNELGQGGDDSSQGGGTGPVGSNQAIFNNFFSNPGDDIKDIYNDSSGTTNKSSNSITNAKARSGLANQSNHSRTDEDAFKNFSFYDSPLEENEMLQQIRSCCTKIGQLPQHLLSSNPSMKINPQKQLNHNLNKLSTHMQNWSTKKLIFEEQEEEDESHMKKQSSGQKSHKTTNEENQQLYALPSESSSSIIIDQNDIALDNLISSKKGFKKTLIEDTKTRGLLDDGSFLVQTKQQIIDDLNGIGSFSSKSINTYDESNQSVAQEFKTNESIPANSYAIANMKQGEVPQGGNQKLMNSDEIMKINNVNQITAGIATAGGHAYKKSMINPTFHKQPLEIALPDQDLELKNLYGSNKIKQDSSTHKTSIFLPNQFASPGNRLPQQQNTLKDKGSPMFKETLDNKLKNMQIKEEQKHRGLQSPTMPNKQPDLTHQTSSQQTNSTAYATFPTQFTNTIYKFQTPDQNDQSKYGGDYQNFPKKSFLQESAQQLQKQFQAAQSPNNHHINPNYDDLSPEEKKTAFTKRQTTAKFRSMDLTSNSLNRINAKITEKAQQYENQGKEMKKQQDILADLKEASLEGANSISLSPQRGCLPDFNPTPGIKIQTLKKTKAQPSKPLPKNLKSKATDVHSKIESESIASINPSKTMQSKLTVDTKKKQLPIASAMGKPPGGALKINDHQNIIAQQQQQQKQFHSNQQQQDGAAAQGKTSLSSKNANQKPNLFSEKSQSNLQSVNINQHVGTPTFVTSGTSHLGSQQMKTKLELGTASNKEYSSVITTGSSVNTPGSATSMQKNGLGSPNKAKLTIKKTLQQIDNAASRNENPKMTNSSGVGTTGSLGGATTGASTGKNKTTQPPLLKKPKK